MAVEITGLPLTPLSSKEASQDDASKKGVNDGSNNSTNTVTPTSSDSMTISSKAEAMKLIEAEVNSQSVVDDSRIEDLKLAIDTGQYNINTQRVAEKFIQFETLLTA